jgi:PPOX class probable F420-dependent enzyme
MPGISRLAVVQPLPEDHVDLLDRPLPTVLTTEMPDGRLQSTVVWCNRVRGEVLMNTMREFQKAKNLRSRPLATVLVVDPDDDGRWLEVRGEVMLEEDGATEHLDQLTQLYMGVDAYFGGAVPAELAATEHPVRIRLVPDAVTTGQRRLPAGRRTGRATPLRWNIRRGCERDATIPDSHRDLLERPLIGSLATRLPSGAAQTQPVWFEVDGNDALVNTTRERQKGRDLEADPRATLLVVDPDDSVRWIEIRADVDLVETGAEEELDRLARRYTRHERFYGAVYPTERRSRETRVIARLHPQRINRDAIHT